MHYNYIDRIDFQIRSLMKTRGILQVVRNYICVKSPTLGRSLPHKIFLPRNNKFSRITCITKKKELILGEGLFF